MTFTATTFVNFFRNENTSPKEKSPWSLLSRVGYDKGNKEYIEKTMVMITDCARRNWKKKTQNLGQLQGLTHFPKIHASYVIKPNRYITSQNEYKQSTTPYVECFTQLKSDEYSWLLLHQKFNNWSLDWWPAILYK